MGEVLQFLLPLTDPLEEMQAGPSELPRYLPEDTLQLADDAARKAALDIRQSWIVEAPAGSGKTGLLIQRFLKLLAETQIDRPGEVLAITFTRKAATELRTRILEQLADAGANKAFSTDAGAYERTTRQLALAVLTRDREQNWRLLESPHQLRIQTIDAFCGELIGSLPLLSGGAGGLRPVDDAGPLYEEAARRTVLQMGGSDRVLDASLRCVVTHRDGVIGDCVHLIAEMLGAREQWGELIPLQNQQLTDEYLDGPVRHRLERTLGRVIGEALTDAGREIPPDLMEELACFAARLSTAPSSNGSPSPIASCFGLNRAPGTRAADLEHWRSLLHLVLTKRGEWRSALTPRLLAFEIGADDRNTLEILISRLKARGEFRPELRRHLCALRSLPSATYPDDQWRVAKALFRVLRQALIELQILFAERRACDFTEISLSARSILSSAPDPLNAAGAQLTHLLVDEMQDTSAGQYELLELLTRGWDGATQTLFLVGDPKQSIYLFRQARVARFLRTQASGRLGDVPMRALRLTANFRSRAGLVHHFNEAFERILPPPQAIAQQRSESVEVPFVAASATRVSGFEPSLRWHVHVKGDEDDGLEMEGSEDGATRALSEASGEAEARSIREVIEDFRDRWEERSQASEEPLRPARIAVLARNRAHLAPILREFHTERSGKTIPFRAIDVEVLNERPEVLDLLALTRALLHPGDRVAWLAVLHSPVCGLGVADLLALAGEGPEADRAATVAHLVTTRSSLLSPEGQILLHRAWNVLAEAQATLGRTLFSTHVERTWRTLGGDAPLREEERNNARRFLHLVRELESSTEPLSLGLLLRRLGKLYAEPSTDPDAVELLTIHKAKGLEWDLVLVPALERSAGNDRPDLLNWLELDGAPGAEGAVLLAPIQGKGEASTALYKWLANLRQQRESAEAKRLFYVACTRAREELHLYATAELKKDGQIACPDGNNLLRASWAAAEPVLTQWLAEAGSASNSSTSSVPRLTVIAGRERPQLESLALAAAGDSGASENTPFSAPNPPLLYRLPPEFDPRARFRRENGPQLPYPPASAMRQTAAFTRPEGSFASRAFGNTVHRFLDRIARRRSEGATIDDLLAELPKWHGRVETAFRSEGVPRSAAASEAARALGALQSTLRDPIGRWLLAPHAGAQSERAIQLGVDSAVEAASRSLRADRVFFAGAEPLSTGEDTHLWIVDFKTSERGGRQMDAFFAAERAQYEPQLQAYARAVAKAERSSHPLVLALFYPLLTQMLYWPHHPENAS